MPKENWEDNRSFSERVPRLQVAVDSTSLGAFKRCPRFYYYSIVQGWTGTSVKVDLAFGIAAHRGLELFHKLRAKGLDYESSVQLVVTTSMIETWDSEAQAPRFDDAQKNRLSLTRLLVEYLDRYEAEGIGPRTLILPSGAPAVELSFAFDSGLAGPEPVLLCGHIDRLVEINSEIYVSDLKTTRSALGSRYADQFSPDNQFSLYSIAGRIAFKQAVRGILLDAAQVGTTFVRLARFPIPRPAPVLDEWLQGFVYWYGRMRGCAEEADQVPEVEAAFAWPQNDAACSLYGGCAFREICSRSPASRQRILEANWTLRHWDPVGEPR